MERDYLKSVELAKRWKISDYSIRYWRITGKGPTFHKINGSIRYYLDDIEYFEKEMRRRHTSEPAKPFVHLMV